MRVTGGAESRTRKRKRIKHPRLGTDERKTTCSSTQIEVYFVKGPEEQASFFTGEVTCNTGKITQPRLLRTGRVISHQHGQINSLFPLALAFPHAGTGDRAFLRDFRSRLRFFPVRARPRGF